MLVSLSKTCNGRNNVKLKENNRSEQLKSTIKVQLTFPDFVNPSIISPRKTMSSRGQSYTCSNCEHMTGAYSLPRSTCRRGPATCSGRAKWLISARTWPSWTVLWTIPPTTTKYSLGRESTSVPWMCKTRVLSTTSSQLPVRYGFTRYGSCWPREARSRRRSYKHSHLHLHTAQIIETYDADVNTLYKMQGKYSGQHE